MIIDTEKIKYIPGSYAIKRPSAAQLADQYVRQWEKRKMEKSADDVLPSGMPPTLCFSRKIGIGALEIAEMVAEKLQSRVADRLIIEQIAGDAELSKKTVDFFDERYPGKLTELAKFLFGEKSFTMGDYFRKLASAVYTLAEAEPTIFVGRGTHLILPRENVLAVRCISSREFRIKRVADILGTVEDVAAKELEDADHEQRDFFKKAYGKKDAPAAEFDLVINCDFISNPKWAAETVATAFAEKFHPAVEKHLPGKEAA
jgi:cytidylate kinase